MGERERLNALLEKVKKRIAILDAIEERLLNMRGLAVMSFEYKNLDDERQKIQIKINRLYEEIKLLEKDPTLES